MAVGDRNRDCLAVSVSEGDVDTHIVTRSDVTGGVIRVHPALNVGRIEFVAGVIILVAELVHLSAAFAVIAAVSVVRNLAGTLLYFGMSENSGIEPDTVVTGTGVISGDKCVDCI